MNLSKIQTYLEEGWLEATKHHTLPLTIYNSHNDYIYFYRSPHSFHSLDWRLPMSD
jgi:hypothetical protein